MTSRPGLFVAALVLCLVNALVLTGAIVSVVYSYKLTRFAAIETFDYVIRAPRYLAPPPPVAHHSVRRKVKHNA